MTDKNFNEIPIQYVDDHLDEWTSDDDPLPPSTKAKRAQVDNSVASGNTHVHFKQLVSRLVEYIGEAEVVVGCVAWVTHPEILRALGRKRGVSIVLQKEDFLRPDVAYSITPNWARELHGLYDALQPIHSMHIWHEFSAGLYLHGDTRIEAVRCLGIARAGANTLPRMHHKFVVFCRQDEQTGQYEPYAVWTGSFNFTRNASSSLENAVYIADPVIARSYLAEWGQVLAVSEQLDWTEENIVQELQVRNNQTWTET